MRRRDFIRVVAGSVAAWPLAARAQQPDRKRRLGVLISGVTDADAGYLFRRLSYPSPSMARYEIPKQLPEFVECGDVFVPSDEATVEQWQRHKNPDNSVDQILKLAEKIGLPDNIPLLPRLRALAKINVLAFNQKF